MKLTNATSKSLIFLDKNFTKKEEIFKYLTHEMFEQGKIESEEDFLRAIHERERESVTGLKNGLAIPHGKSNTVKEACFAILRTNEVVSDYKSLNPTNEVRLIFLLAIPSAEAGTTHLEILSALSTKLANSNYRTELMNAKSVDEIYALLNQEEKEQSSGTSESDKSDNKELILGITACAAGIAHTYMAAEALRKAAQKREIRVHIEKQGAKGIEDRISSKDVNEANVIIYAHDVALKDLNRFKGLPSIDIPVADPIKNADKVLDEALEKSEGYIPGSKATVADDEGFEKEKSIGTEIKDSVLTGISYIIPIIIAGGMIGAIAVIITQLFGLQGMLKTESSWLFQLKTLGGNMLGTLMVPVLSAYMAYSIGDKPALGPGFAGGLAANMINSGFLGGMLGGLLAGFLIKWMKKNIKSEGVFSGFITFWIYPVVGSLIIGILMLFVVGKPVAWINTALVNMLNGMAGTSAILLGAVIGAMVSFDLGGPVNKAAYAFCLGAMANGNFVPYCIFASVKMVSAFSVSGACYLRKDLFKPEEREIGNQTWILGLAGITEGAIPFAMSDPIRVIGSFIAGSIVTGGIVSYFNIGLNVPGAGIFSMLLLKGEIGSFMGAVICLGAALIGALISTVLLIVTRKQKLGKSLTRV
ncbi:PTS 2-O-a-mannosyl-D-glycerate transporter subunit IIABC [Lactobacillus halodurans]|uniref:PTS 2-O-a-mannosyl-D-glycerate transporter subunit IIABC n=1 Tax=Companilactobacillus halodurans TaxID=2584183 RepID=A0A5P0ZPZ2_9LACO|nr:PTS 2-O-a-mannosyl-D-glycerate transporter subunit IIABC [Companilactobacillus halodurans]MQS76320.1 PTS 2-O-a-mannosyl-D-glycerate transporter subunit IIABC [Companilactobacillus halodurans]